MRIELTRQNSGHHFVAENESGAQIHLDASPEVGGENRGLRPMEAVAAAIGGCSAIDIGQILRKQRQTLTDFRISVAAEKVPVAEYSEFREVEVHFQLWGEVSPDKARNAVQLSLGKYCSVSKLVAHTAKITATLTVNNEPLGRVYPN